MFLLFEGVTSVIKRIKTLLNYRVIWIASLRGGRFLRSTSFAIRLRCPSPSVYHRRATPCCLQPVTVLVTVIVISVENITTFAMFSFMQCMSFDFRTALCGVDC